MSRSHAEIEFCPLSFRYSYQPSVPEGARDTLAVHAAATVASNSQSTLSSISLVDCTRDLENISISPDSDGPGQDPVGGIIPDRIVLDSRINEESLSKFRPLADISSRTKRHLRPDTDSEPIDKRASPDTAIESKKINVSHNSMENSTKDASSPLPLEESLIMAFESIQISSLKPTLQKIESNRSQPEILIKPETFSRLARGTLATKTRSGHSKWKDIDTKV